MIRLSTIAAIMLLAACALPRTASSPAPSSAADSTPNCPAAAESYPEWVAHFRAYAIHNGASVPIVQQAFANVRVNPRIAQAASAQPEYTTPIWTYLDRTVNAARVARGRALREQHRAVLENITREYDVPAEVIVAIWGIESDYGRFAGDVNIFEALSNLGYADTTRAAFSCRELLAALKIAATGTVAPQQMTGSWAGAMGQPQLLPSAYLNLAVDRTGNGHPDIWHSLPDVFASIANHLREDGWRAGVPWGMEVVLPQGFPYQEAELDKMFAFDHWRARGVRRSDGTPLPKIPASAAILVPTGARGPAFLVTENFKAILGYNYSTSYALAVALLGEAVAQRPGVKGHWPIDEAPLSLTERKELQQALIARGLFAGPADGAIGLMTRRAIRAFQAQNGLVQDGWASKALLARLRQTS
ncbi:MAG TPA: lytic murein transglycosylase [Dongiaceae bacterium]|jgi:lytic murein transglycosylase|nr:lytic murein transglycosylase [Dongiaceae bacterium]